MEQNRNKQSASAVRRPRRRPCLACGQAFVAEGPFLRVCALCKESEEWLSGDDDFALHVAPHAREAANDN